MNKKLIKVLTLTALASAFVFIHILIKVTHNCTCLSDIIFPGVKIDFANNESKLFLVRNAFLLLAFFLFAHVTLVILLRYISGSRNPASQQDPSYITLINKIINNTIEQSIIFFGFYIYLIFEGPYQKFSAIQLLNFPTWFFCGRVLFSLGYIIGAIVGIQQLRAYGFAMSIAVNVLLIENLFLPVQFVSNFLLT